MKKSLILFTLLLCSYQFFGQGITADNGITLTNNVLQLGGTLNKTTLVDGNFKSLRYTNLDTFYLGGRFIQFLNSTKKTFITSFDSLNLLSSGDILLSAVNNLTLDGKIKMLGYRNNTVMDSVLTVDNCGNLKLVSQGGLLTISQNAFTRSGNSFGTSAFLGTNDKNRLWFRTNSINRGFIDTTGTFSYDYPVNINNSKLKLAGGDIEINGIQPYATTFYEKASKGINFVNEDEPLPRGTISFNSTTNSINYTAHGSLQFYSKLTRVPGSNDKPDLIVQDGTVKFGGRYSIVDSLEPSAAYQFAEYIDIYGHPKGILFPRLSYTYLRNAITNPADGLIIYNLQTHNLEIRKDNEWHRFLTVNVDSSAVTVERVSKEPETTVSEERSNSYVAEVGDGNSKTFTINHNLNGKFIMVQFIDCGPEANCNLLMNIPEGVKVELEGKNQALITFKTAPAPYRYKVMFLKVQ